jgi:hypothetical protein
MRKDEIARRLCAYSAALAFAALATVPGCGSSSGGGIDGSGVVFGPIEELGSIVVSGITFDVDKATVTLDGQTGSTAELRLGMVVRVEGVIDKQNAVGVAENVDFDDSVEGPVSAIDAAASRFVVLGRTVIIGTETVFDDVTFATLVIGDVVEVSGLFDADGDVRATRVERREAATELEITGRIEALDTDNRTFAIGNQPVDYSAAQIEDAPPGGLFEGLRVEVHGAGPLVGAFLIADEVRVRQNEDEEGLDVETEGFITEVLSSTSFVLGGQFVASINSGTEIRNGTISDIAVNVRVEVHGRINQFGILVLEELEF